MRVGRNDPCPCGSGKKFKHCHIGVERSVEVIAALSKVPPEIKAHRIHSQFVDLDGRLRIVVSNDVLFNQLRRDSPRIAEGFDALCARELDSLNADVVEMTAIFAAVATKPSGPEDSELRQACFLLLQNAVHTFIAAIDLLRRGFRLQPGILVRSVLEILSTVCHVVINQKDLAKLKAGRLQSTRTLASAKQVIPPFGHMYGLLSDNFTHVGVLHLSTSGESAISEYKPNEDALTLNLNFLHSTAWMINVVAELAFYESLSSHRFFRKLAEGAFIYDPSETEKVRLRDLMR